MTSCLLCWCLTASLQPGPAPLPPPAPIVPVVGLPAPCPQPISVCDFAQGFQPVAGCYEVVFIHPTKCCPVKVCFKLPPGCPKVCVGKRDLVFDYGCQKVTIQFKLLFCKAAVYYN